MSKSQKILKYWFGTCRSGIDIIIPKEDDEAKLRLYLQSLSTEDQVDVYCVSEFWSIRFDKHQYDKEENALISKVTLILKEIAANPPLLALLTSRNLHISANRAREGKRLCRMVKD